MKVSFRKVFKRYYYIILFVEGGFLSFHSTQYQIQWRLALVRYCEVWKKCCIEGNEISFQAVRLGQSDSTNIIIKEKLLNSGWVVLFTSWIRTGEQKLKNFKPTRLINMNETGGEKLLNISFEKLNSLKRKINYILFGM